MVTAVIYAQILHKKIISNKIFILEVKYLFW